MPLYCKRQSAFRPLALGISAVVTGTTITLLAQTVGWATLGYFYVIIATFFYVICVWLVYQLLGPANRYLIRLFGEKELELQLKAVALEIIVALFDRKELPAIRDDDDLVRIEAASSLLEVLSGEGSDGS